MKIYTKTGDGGQTGLFGGPRVWKDDYRIEAYGSVDELNAVLGLVRSESIPAELDGWLGRIQHALFAIGAELATPDPESRGTALITDEEIVWLETRIDKLDEQLPPLTSFILPCGVRGAAGLHLGRTICRRAERRVVSLSRAGEPVSATMLRYLNRLSDLLFVMARQVNAAAGTAEVNWEKPASGRSS